MSLSALQADVVRVLVGNRSKRTFFGGSVMFNRTHPRRSDHADLHVEDAPPATVAERDVRTLRSAGFEVEVDDSYCGFVVLARVRRDGERTEVEWNEADARRFFPVAPDPQLGWILHPGDLAVKKLVAAAARRKARDAFDMLLLHRRYLDLGALAWAAPAKFDGSASPVRILERALQTAVEHPMADYRALAVDDDRIDFDLDDVKEMFSDAVAHAIDYCTGEALEFEPACLFVDRDTGRPAKATTANRARLVAHGISERGTVPIIGGGELRLDTSIEPEGIRP